MPIYNNYTIDKAFIDEVYDQNSIGRILYDLEIDSMTFFESIIQYDMNELHALKEGTLLEAEVKETNKKSLKDIIKRLIERAKAWGRKILSMIRNAIINLKNKISDEKDYRAFIKCYKNWHGEIKLPSYDRFEFKDINSVKADESLKKAQSIPELFNKICRIPNIDGNEKLKKYMQDHLYKEEKITDKNVDVLIKDNRQEKDSIAKLKKTSKEIEKYISSLEHDANDISEDVLSDDNVNINNFVATSFNIMKVYTLIVNTAISINEYNYDHNIICMRKIVEQCKSGANNQDQKDTDNEENNSKDIDNDIAPEFKKFVEDKALISIRNYLSNYLIMDTSYKTYNKAFKYATDKLGAITVNHDRNYSPLENDRSKWTADYLNGQIVAAVSNFSIERINHIKQVISVVYKK